MAENEKTLSERDDINCTESNVACNGEKEFEQLESYSRMPIPEPEKILLVIRNAKKKLEINSASREEIAAKCNNLKEILDYIYLHNKHGMCPYSNVFGEIVEMVAVNLFRKLPGKTKPLCPDAIEDERFPTEPLWEHVYLVYTILQRLILLDGNIPILREHISERFLQQLMELFDSDDLRERDKLKVVVHRAYCKVFVWRPIFRKKISELLLRHIHDADIQGVNEILQLYGCIVAGFSAPIKNEHVRFLEKVLISLHKPDNLQDYHKFLAYCLVQFLYLDEKLTKAIFSGLFRYWPRNNSQKEIIFLDEVVDLLQVVTPEQFQLIIEPLFRQITKCMMGPHVEVSKKAFSIWENQRVLALIVMNHEIIMSIVFPAMYLMRKSHWSPTITSQMYGLFKTFMLMNRDLFDELVKACKTTMKFITSTPTKKESQKSVHFKNSEEILYASDQNTETSSLR